VKPANHLIGAKHPAFSTNQLADTDNTQNNYNQERHKTYTTSQ